MIAEMTVTSLVFAADGAIPAKYTCEGENVSPPLSWTRAPAGTKSLVLIAHDPDAPVGDWVHWVLFNLPPTEEGLPEGVPTVRQLANGAVQGLNDFRRHGYGGPCPPAGSSHRYYFKIFALNTLLELGPDAKRIDVEEAMQSHVLAQGQIMGTYER